VEKQEYQRRRREKIISIIIFSLIIILTAVEVHILKVSSKLPISSSIFFFGLMNINIILAMILLFLIFRNALKLILDEKRGKIGAKLKTRLVFSFLLFAIIPTIFLFTISAFYIKSSFDKWFNLRIGNAFQRSIDVVQHSYENTEKNARHFAQKISSNFIENKVSPELIYKKLEASRSEYDIDAVEYYENIFGRKIISSHLKKNQKISPVPVETLKMVFANKEVCKIQNNGNGELIRCGVSLTKNKGAIFVNYFVPLSLANQLSEIQLTYSDFKKENPLNYPIKSTYFMILLMVTLLILFSAAWTGFYVAKKLTKPIEELSRGTEEIARGNLNYTIDESYGDEMGRLIHSFNKMTQDLREHQSQIQKIERINAWTEVAKRMAHEIKNPLTPIQLSIERLRRRYLDKIQDDGTFNEATNIVLNEVQSLKKLVSEFNTFARLPETKLLADDLNAIIIEAVNLFRAAHEKIKFDLDLSPSLSKIPLDRSQIKRALINLFDNAVSAMPDAGSVKISTKVENGFIQLVIADEGMGIPDDLLPKLFEPLKQHVCQNI
jgi:two-component system nitrogen regulation sensor histidine kinase NtrY